MIPIIVGLAISFPFIISEISPAGHTSNPPDLQLIDTLVEFGCSELAIYHLMDVSSILDKEFSGEYDMHLIGLPDGLLKEDFDKCVDIAISIRESNYTTTPEPERKILECYGIFHCNVSSQYFESCIGAKKNGVTIEQLCLDSDITIDNGCATIKFPDGTGTVSCHYEVKK